MNLNMLYPFNHPFTGSVAGLVYAYALGKDPKRGAQVGFGVGAAALIAQAVLTKRVGFDTQIPVVEEVIGGGSPALASADPTVVEVAVPVTTAAGSCTRVHRMRIPAGMAGHGCGCGCGCPRCGGALRPISMGGTSAMGCAECGGICGGTMAGTYRLI